MLVFNHNAEARLAETLGEMRDQHHSWTLVIFRLSELTEQYKNDYQTNIALNLVKDLLREEDGAIYLFAGGSMAVLCNYLSASLLHKLIFQLRYLYMDDPLAYTADGAENAEFCTVYPLAERWHECVRDVTRLMARPPVKKHVSAKGPFGAATLATVERDLQKVDIMQALSRQPICAFAADGGIRRVFDELYISITHLREMLRAEVDFLSNRWLFKYLTRLLDERMLARFSASEENFKQPVSININAETLLSEHFKRFDAALPEVVKVAVVFEIQVVDVFADMRSFSYAREAAQKQGYRICIDGLSAASFLHVDRARLGADLMKLQWNADGAGDLSSRGNRELAAAVGACGNGRVILCRCDGKDAVDYGQSLGISLFQGRYVDRLLNPEGEEH